MEFSAPQLPRTQKKGEVLEVLLLEGCRKMQNPERKGSKPRKNSPLEPKNHPIEKENHLPNLRFWVQNVNFQGSSNIFPFKFPPVFPTHSCPKKRSKEIFQPKMLGTFFLRCCLVTPTGKNLVISRESPKTNRKTHLVGCFDCWYL